MLGDENTAHRLKSGTVGRGMTGTRYANAWGPEVVVWFASSVPAGPDGAPIFASVVDGAVLLAAASGH